MAEACARWWVLLTACVQRSVPAHVCLACSTSCLTRPPFTPPVPLQGPNPQPLSIPFPQAILSLEPMKLKPPARVTAIAAGGDHSMAVTVAGALLAFGSNKHGQVCCSCRGVQGWQCGSRMLVAAACHAQHVGLQSRRFTHILSYLLCLPPTPLPPPCSWAPATRWTAWCPPRCR